MANEVFSRNENRPGSVPAQLVHRAWVWSIRASESSAAGELLMFALTHQITAGSSEPVASATSWAMSTPATQSTLASVARAMRGWLHTAVRTLGVV